MAFAKYKVEVEVVFKLSIPVDGKDDDQAIAAFEKIIENSDNYEIVNRAYKRTIEIKEIKVQYE